MSILDMFNKKEDLPTIRSRKQLYVLGDIVDGKRVVRILCKGRDPKWDEETDSNVCQDIIYTHYLK